MSRLFAYARVSTSEQTTDNQLRDISAAGFSIERKRTVTESVSGSVAAGQRPGFAKLIDRMEEGDVLVVIKLDRLGRNAMDVRATVEKLSALGIEVHCLQLGVTPWGKTQDYSRTRDADAEAPAASEMVSTGW
jgi:putative DNA-invertase from lambdoid prophage Rac